MTEAATTTTTDIRLQNAPKAQKDLLFVEHELIEGLVLPNPANRIDQDNRAHIGRLRKKMREFGFSKDHPIIIGSDGIIKKGHHRYFAAIEEGVGIWVEINDDFTLVEHARMDNVAKKWSSRDWIMNYARAGNSEYVRILDFMSRHQFGIKVTLALVTGKMSESSQEVFDMIETGSFKVKDWDRAKGFAKGILDFEPLFPNQKDCRNTHFALAVIYLLNQPKYAHHRMIEQASKQSRRLRLQRTRKENVEMLVEIYNHSLKGHNRLDLKQ